MKWIRYRFTTESEDFRPIIFNKSYPWWCSGYDSDDNAICIIYLPKGDNLNRYWDDAFNITEEECEKIEFTSRFPKPEWYQGLD